jgi:uncharacterized membrane protein
MKRSSWLESSIFYGYELIRSALEGARSAGRQMPQAESSHEIMARAARVSLSSSLAAASVGVATGYVITRRKPPAKALAFGLLGGVLGFLGGMAWSTRGLTRGMARGAMKEVSATRDAHWLSKHPIDYA